MTVQAWVWAVSPAVHRCVAAVPMLCEPSLGCAELRVPRAAGWRQLCPAQPQLWGSSMELLLIYRDSDTNTEPQVSQLSFETTVRADKQGACSYRRQPRGRSSEHSFSDQNAWHGLQRCGNREPRAAPTAEGCPCSFQCKGHLQK